MAGGAGLGKHGEPFCKGYAEQFDVDQVRISLRDQPDIVSEDYPCDEVNRVVASQRDHQHALEAARDQTKPSKLKPAVSLVLAVADDAAADVPREEEVVSASVRNCY